jgi:hypothetical protein
MPLMRSPRPSPAQHIDSELSPEAAQARELRGRAARMYERARGYCLRALAVRHPGIADLLIREPVKAAGFLASTAREDVAALFWSGVGR